MQRVAANAARCLTVHRSIESFRTARKALPSTMSVGFVPTMGALHAGHLSLVKEARAQNDIVVVSIYVNPTQFAPGEDFDKYPRQVEQDSNLLANLDVDHVFLPENASMYGSNFVTYVDPTGFDHIPEGIVRPGHFRGVATVVCKLFNIVQPTNAYFGQKDAAQCCMIRRMVNDLNMDLNVAIMDTVREDDGLAMSSRNAYLTPTERAAAPIVYKSLRAVRQFHQQLFPQQEALAGASSTSSTPIRASQLQQIVEDTLRTEPLVKEIQYVSVDSKDTMQTIQEVGSEGAVISLACKVGSVRLIDNIVL